MFRKIFIIIFIFIMSVGLVSSVVVLAPGFSSDPDFSFVADHSPDLSDQDLFENDSSSDSDGSDLSSGLSTHGDSSDHGALHGRIIILDPGHGSDTTNTFQGYNEQVVMLKLAHKIKPLLEANGAFVHMTRKTYDGVTLATRIALTNVWSLTVLRASMIDNAAEIENIDENLSEVERLINIMLNIIIDPEEYSEIYFNTPFSPTAIIHPDLVKIFELQSNPVISDRFLFISLHSNATGRPINTGVHGADVYYASNTHYELSRYFTGYSHPERSIAFGEILLDHIHDVGIQRRSVNRANFFVIREHNLPAVLVENGYHTNQRDRENLMDDEFLDKLAVAYLDAIKTYFADIPLPPIPSDPDVSYIFQDIFDFVNIRNFRVSLNRGPGIKP